MCSPVTHGYNGSKMVCAGIIMMIIGYSIFMGVYIGGYQKNLDNNNKYTDATCLITETYTANISCSAVYGCTCEASGCDAPMTCAQREQTVTSGPCCGEICCVYESCIDTHCNCARSTTSKCQMLWGTCYSVFSRYRVIDDFLNYTFTEIDGSCDLGDTICPLVISNNFQVGQYQPCWISWNNNQIQVTATDPTKDTRIMSTVSVFFLVVAIIGTLMVIFAYCRYAIELRSEKRTEKRQCITGDGKTSYQTFYH